MFDLRCSQPHSFPQPTAEVFRAFYRGDGQDTRGRKIEEIWGWPDSHLERSHDYIQWLFPTDQESMFNPGAPNFPKPLQETFRRDPKIVANLRRSFDVYLAFLGFQYVEEAGAPPRVVRTAVFEAKDPITTGCDARGCCIVLGSCKSPCAA